MTLNLYLYCGEKGHLVSKCPIIKTPETNQGTSIDRIYNTNLARPHSTPVIVKNLIEVEGLNMEFLI
jgi:hypothetical protein